MSDTLAAKDANSRRGKQHTVRLAAEEPRGSAALQVWTCRVSDMCAVPPDLVVACDDIRAYDNGVSGSYGLLYFKNPMPSCPVDVRTVLELNMGGGTGTVLDPYITRAAGIALLGNTSSTIWISDGGRSGVRDEDVSLSATIRPGFTAVNYLSPPVLNLRFKTLAAGYRYTCGQDVGTQHLRCWGQREAFGETVTNGVLGAFAVGQNHVCYQVTDLPGGGGAVPPQVVCSGSLGSNSFGQLTPPTALTDGSTAITQMCAGQYHTCAIIAGTKKLRCWGKWGGGNITSSGQVFQSDSNVEAIGCGASHVCVVNASGIQITCTDGSASCGDKCTVPGTWVKPDGDRYKLTGGVNHTCGVTQNAQVFCWGKGTGTGGALVVPDGLGLGSQGGGVVQVTAGPDHACVRKPNGQVTCWGYCASGACNIPRPAIVL
ncbi:hypothetical protein OEZ86_010370 [Tetradesmus obliquus]|nr:hypothetical protein OEZ86_010367 [Tetradesmus obliquus]WIA43989.1 hypothetical protein OEZ86_010370 [Tetradesmus obliquus]